MIEMIAVREGRTGAVSVVESLADGATPCRP